MGGMIVQSMVLKDRARVRSMTSIMSSTGNPELPSSTDEAMAAMLSPAATNREEAIALAEEIVRSRARRRGGAAAKRAIKKRAVKRAAGPRKEPRRG